MAGRRNRNGYQEYRGRSGARPVLLFIIVLLAVLLLAGIAFMVFMGDYIKYTPTGMEIDWPWRRDPTQPPQPSHPGVNVTGDLGVAVVLSGALSGGTAPRPRRPPTPGPTPSWWR